MFQMKSVPLLVLDAMASRASVEFYFGPALKGQNERAKEVIGSAFVIKSFQNFSGVCI
jgi:hypothetical protein